MNYIDQLERKTRGVFQQLKSNQTSPSKAKIGVLLNQIKQFDLPLYENLLEEYKIIKEEWDNLQEKLIFEAKV